MLTAITLYNLSVQIETHDSRLETLANEFIKRFYTAVNDGFTNNSDPTVKEFSITIPKYKAFIFSNSQFKHFMGFLDSNGFKLTQYEVINKRDYEHVEEPYKVRDGWVLREEQEPVAEFIEECYTGTRLLPLATGSGKTFIALNSLGKLQNRFAVVIIPQFIEKWVADIVEIHDAKEEEIVVIRGSKAIKDLVEMIREGECPWKYFIFSLPTLRNFVTDFETNPDECEEKYGIMPLDFFPLLQIHTMLIDEVHLSFHAVFKLLLVSNVKFLLALSATLIPTDQLEARVYKVIFNDENVYHDSLVKQYIKCFPVAFNASPKALKKLRWSMRRNKYNRSVGMYSPPIFEQSIMKEKDLLGGYFDIIDDLMERFYFEDYITGDKSIIFVYTIDMATILTQLFQRKYPDKLVRRYVQDDSYDEMLEGDIIITTIGSAGTGLDIPNLRVAIQTVTVMSPKSNIQVLGRLRKLKDRDVKFFYIYCSQIDKQESCHRLRMKLFRNRVASINCLRSPLSLSLGD